MGTTVSAVPRSYPGWLSIVVSLAVGFLATFAIGWLLQLVL